MNKAKLTVGIVLIFVLGMLAGALSLQLYHRHDFRGGPPRHAGAAERVDFIMERLADELELTADQVSQVRPLVETAEKAVSELRDRIGPEIRRIHDQSFEAIRQMLDPPQQKKLDEIRERIKKYRGQSRRG